MHSTATREVPAERFRDGVHVQRVNIYTPGGQFLRQAPYPGTPQEARAWALRQVLCG
ncbi:hypothetical protein [Streptosporangium sp. NPDC051022]|uniref:hypothetical protein n=1 Tax=Streptosporangium sp. NPDC051022 TaxID=3155752 RepID=UPI003438B9BD